MFSEKIHELKSSLSGEVRGQSVWRREQWELPQGLNLIPMDAKVEPVVAIVRRRTLDIEVIKSLEITGHLPPQPAILLITLHGGDHYTVDSVRSP